MITIKVPRRVNMCLDAGDIESLLNLLRDWSVDDLQDLMKELESARNQFEEKGKAEPPRQMLADKGSYRDRVEKSILEVENKIHIDFTSILTEILSVAVYYLEQHGVNVHSEPKT